MREIYDGEQSVAFDGHKYTVSGAGQVLLAAVISQTDEKAASAPSQDLNSLRLGFVGAEKYPEHVYAAFATLCPQAILCEGNGITGCSPVVS